MIINKLGMLFQAMAIFLSISIFSKFCLKGKRSIKIAVHFANLTDKKFLLVTLGKRLETLCANTNIWT